MKLIRPPAAGSDVNRATSDRKTQSRYRLYELSLTDKEAWEALRTNWQAYPEYCQKLRTS